MKLPRWSSYFLAFYLPPLVQAYTVFETNCSAPVITSNYVSSPNTRGTLDILWSSLFTIFACTWTLQHPNVPKQRDEDVLELQDKDAPKQQDDNTPKRQDDDKPKSRGWVAWILFRWRKTKRRIAKLMHFQREKINATWRDAKWRETKWKNVKWGLKKFGRSTLRMLSTILAPELIIAAACDDFIAARENLKKMKKYAKRDKVPWTLRHSYYANMGGFVIRFQGKPIGVIPLDPPPAPSVTSEPPATPLVNSEPPAAPSVPEILVSEIPVPPASSVPATSAPPTSSAPTISLSVPPNPLGRTLSTTSSLNSSEPNPSRAEAASQGSAPLGPYLNPYHLTGANIITLRRNGYISKLPYIKEAEIKDRSKGDVLVKIIALGQIVWSIFQIVVRAVRRLPVSPLDVAVAAYAVCAVIIYFIYWGKPQRVDYAHTIQLFNPQNTTTEENKTNTTTQQKEATSTNTTTPQKDTTGTTAQQKESTSTGCGSITRLVLTDPLESDPMTHEILQLIKFNGNRRIFREEMKELLKLQPAPMGAPISMDSSKRPWYKMRVPAFAALGAVQFGGIHAIAWNFAFPSTFELIFWRCASIYMTAAPLCAWLLFFLYAKVGLSFLSSTFERRGNLVLKAILYLIIFLYLIARLFILVEMFRTLCFLPPGSYVSTWTTNMPHLA